MEEVDRHLFFALNPKNVLSRISALSTLIAPDMPEETSVSGNTYSRWTDNINTTRTFATNRGMVYRNLLLASSRYDFPAPPRVLLCEQEQTVNTGNTVVRLRGTRFLSNTIFPAYPSTTPISGL